MNRSVLLLSFALVACGGSGEPKEPKVDPTQTRPAAPIVLPPSIAATKSFRCKDNTVLIVDFMSDGLSANVTTEKGSAPVRVKGAAAGQVMVGEGVQLTGAKEDKVVTVVKGGAKPLSCHV